MLIKLFEENPSPRLIKTITECLMDGGIIIYPTDTVYGIGCSINKPKAIDKIAQLKGIKTNQHNFSLICSDVSQLSNYVRPIPNHIFRVLNKVLPGPYTFILEANNLVPKLIFRNKKYIGIRIPDNVIVREIIRSLENPLLSSSIPSDDEDTEYQTDPELIYERYNNQVDIIIDGGYGDIIHSTIIDCTNDDFELIRKGKGKVDFL